MQWFTAEFRNFYQKNQNLAFGWTTGTCHQVQASQGFS